MSHTSQHLGLGSGLCLRLGLGLGLRLRLGLGLGLGLGLCPIHRNTLLKEDLLILKSGVTSLVSISKIE